MSPAWRLGWGVAGCCRYPAYGKVVCFYHLPLCSSATLRLIIPPGMPVQSNSQGSY